MKLLQEINQFYYKMSLYELKLLNCDDFFQGISYHTLLYINIIAMMPDCTVSKIASALNITKSAVTLKINELEKQGIICKQQSQSDKRIYYVTLDAKAKQLLQAYDDTFMKAEKRLKKRFDETQIATFVEVLHEMAHIHNEVMDHE